LRPLAALLGIVTGSSVALLAGLVMTFLVYVLLPDQYERLSGEFRPLLQAIAWAMLLSGLAVAALWSELKAAGWRHMALLGLAATLVAMGWSYWPN
jgi:hypothetical protein